MNALGVHLVLELKDCPADLLDKLHFVQQTLLDAAHSIGATVVGETFHKFAPQGVTGVVAIAESHICIHTWPEYNYAAVDVFTCGTGFDPEKAGEVLIKGFRSAHPSQTIVTRGTLTASMEISQSRS